MQEKKRLTVNIVAQIVTFVVQFCINFFLTPFIVKKLGPEAYGFIGLSNNFISYAQILTVALNSMAGRFIAIEYHKGHHVEAVKFYTSVFYANLIVSIVIGLIAMICSMYLEYFINIPDELVLDVKILFLFLVANFLISIIFSVYNVATFIKNRLDYVAIRSIVANILRACILVVAFTLFIPMIWYVGFASIICTLYISIVNIQFKRRLTPELLIRVDYFKIAYVRKVINSGVWNTVSRLSRVLEHGFDLLLANLFIGAYSMGQFAITKQIPVILLGLISSIGAAFAPSLTKSFAQGSFDNLKKELLVSVKLMGFFSIVPLCFIFTLADVFYNLWLPDQDNQRLFLLTIIGIMYFPILLSLEGVQNLWPVLDKVKTYSLVSLCLSLCSFVTLFVGIHFVSKDYSIYYLAGVSTFYSFIMSLFFIPIYAAKCLNVHTTFFYPSIIKVCGTLILVITLFISIRRCVFIDSWLQLVFVGLIEMIVCSILGFFIILNREERYVCFSLIRKRMLE